VGCTQINGNVEKVMMREIYDLVEYLGLEPTQLADTIFYCPICNREHRIPIKMALTGSDLIEKLPGLTNQVLGKKPQNVGIVYDVNIETKLKNIFFSSINSQDFSYSRIPLGELGVLLDSSVGIGDEAVAKFPHGIDLLIGLGSGVICDLTKWIATKTKLPFIIVGTAASMNAYTSTTATIAENRIKTSLMMDPPTAALLDTGLLSSAPHEMTCAGIADLLARNVCNADWLLSHLIRGTHFCPIPYQIMKSYQEKYLSQIKLLGQNDEEAMKSFGDALLLSGYSMTMLNGETSPSSGSEHVISHFFDFQHEIFDLPKNLHGTQVGIGILIMATAYEVLREKDPSSFDVDEIVSRRSTLDAFAADHIRLFGEHADKFSRVLAAKYVPDQNFRNYLEKIIYDWDGIWQSLNPFLMPPERVREILKSAGAITSLSGISRTQKDAIQAILYGSHYRQRYTVLDLFWELGLFPSSAPEIISRAKV